MNGQRKEEAPLSESNCPFWSSSLLASVLVLAGPAASVGAQVSSLASLLVHSASMSIIASEEDVSEPGEGGPAHTAPLLLLLSPFSSSTIGLGDWGGYIIIPQNGYGFSPNTYLTDTILAITWTRFILSTGKSDPLAR